ncbi:hypothetical protein STRTUCAR8_04641 [Streptomyces turgidiscabies Car8]|uniref:Uncharacterized protein n=1 Tax=Streptomyces turgidiscabies (strain Car8) TaxID=698760 RepID=L7F085_STRT8|nr:hypothetical protein STRTUCAR8_04641 [Streptomyces turgidiscabies Car8]
MEICEFTSLSVAGSSYPDQGRRWTPGIRTGAVGQGYGLSAVTTTR